MMLVVNGREREVTDGLNVEQLLDCLEIPRGRVAVEVNLELVPKTQFARHGLNAGDRVEIVTFVGGG